MILRIRLANDVRIAGHSSVIAGRGRTLSVMILCGAGGRLLIVRRLNVSGWFHGVLLLRYERRRRKRLWLSKVNIYRECKKSYDWKVDCDLLYTFLGFPKLLITCQTITKVVMLKMKKKTNRVAISNITEN